MNRIAIIVAPTEGGLDAVATARGCTLVPGTARQFATLTTYKDPTMAAAGNIDVGAPAWVALATRN